MACDMGKHARKSGHRALRSDVIDVRRYPDGVAASSMSASEKGLKSKAKVKTAQRVTLARTLLRRADRVRHTGQVQRWGQIAGMAGKEVAKEGATRSGGGESVHHSSAVQGVVRIGHIQRRSCMIR